MPFTTEHISATTAPRHPVWRGLLALVIVTVATLLRLAADPVLHDQVPYFIYVGAVVVATWFSGLTGGILAVVVATFAGNYFFVPPRYEVNIRIEDLGAMLTFAGFSFGLVWLVGRWRTAESRLRDLQSRTAAVLDQLPVAVAVSDASGRVLFNNRATTALFQRPFSASIDIRNYRDHFRYQAFLPDGTVLSLDNTPMARALKGEVVTSEEVHVVKEDGTRHILSVSAGPVRDDDGRITSAVSTMTDVTDYRTATTVARQKAEELQTILDTVPAAVFVTRDADASRLEGNRFASEYLRTPPGANVSKTASPDERPTTFRIMKNGREIPGEELPIQAAMARGVAVRDCELDVVHEDGSRRTLFGNAMPLRDDAGQVRGAIGAFVDVTEKRRLESQLQDSVSELEHANRMKDEFLATLSHELRTPLNAILGWSDILLRGRLPPEAQNKALDSIRRNAQAQAALISDILDVSRIITGKLRLDMRPVNLSETVKAACESIQPAADARGVELRLSVESDPVLIGDPDRLQQIFWNLLSNSVKFTERGGRVEVDVRRVDSHLQVVVKDDGAGIAPDFLPHVFERFRQADASTTRAQAGLGLGLALVRSLTELHGGTVTARSDGKGKGATFTVALPVRAVFGAGSHAGHASAKEAETREMAAAGCLDGLHVVAIDDQEEARILVQAVLEQYGARVTACSTAEQVVATVVRDCPDLVLADIGMPGCDGYELIRRIRALGNRRAEALPAVALTAYGGAHDRMQALAAGFCEHLAKPIMPEALVRVVAGAAGRAVLP